MQPDPPTANYLDLRPPIYREDNQALHLCSLYVSACVRWPLRHVHMYIKVTFHITEGMYIVSLCLRCMYKESEAAWGSQDKVTRSAQRSSTTLTNLV